MARRRLVTQHEKELLSLVAKGLLIGSSLIAPNIGVVFKLFPKKSTSQKYYIKKQLDNLIGSKVILLGKDRIVLSKRGQQLLKFSEIDEVKTLKQNMLDWDGIWHLIAYDVPNFKSKERDYFRLKLIQWGFSLIQKSLWLYPYPCTEEVAILAHQLGISPYVISMNTRHIPNEVKYLKRYYLEDDFTSENPELIK